MPLNGRVSNVLGAVPASREAIDLRLRSSMSVVMNIVTVSVGQGALAVVRHNGEAIIATPESPFRELEARGNKQRNLDHWTSLNDLIMGSGWGHGGKPLGGLQGGGCPRTAAWC
jgi:hypothetical protein